MMKIALVAGEHSGDNLGADLIRALKHRFPNAEFIGIGGEGMQAQGLVSLAPMEKLSIMGLVEVLPKVPELYLLRRKLVQQFVDADIDVFIGIDAPDFNLGLAKRLKQQGIKTVHYVSPSVWAWRQKRIVEIKRSVDLMITLFPFEQSFYETHDQRAVCVGHPLANTFVCEKTAYDIAKARAALNVDVEAGAENPTAESQAAESQTKVVALMPGSRLGEVSKLLEDFFDAAKRIAITQPDVQFILSVANDKVESYILEQQLPAVNIRLIKGRSETVMRAADVLLMASGTATFEGLLCKTPMVAAYKLNNATYQIAKRLVKTPYFTLPNILSNAPLVPEHIQHYDTADLAHDVVERLTDNALRESLITQFDAIHQQLQLGGGDKAADAIAQLVQDA